MDSSCPALGELVPQRGLEVGVAWGWLFCGGKVEGSWANSSPRTFSSSMLSPQLPRQVFPALGDDFSVPQTVQLANEV